MLNHIRIYGATSIPPARWPEYRVRIVPGKMVSIIGPSVTNGILSVVAGHLAENMNLTIQHYRSRSAEPIILILMGDG